MPRSIHTAKWDRCVRDVKRKHEAVDPYAVCTASLGVKESIRKKHRRENPDLDETAITELTLFIENDGELYRRQTEPILKNLAIKMRKGNYDNTSAVKLWGYLAASGARKYGEEFGTGDRDGLRMFSPIVRRAVANRLENHYRNDVKEMAEVKKNPSDKFLLSVRNTTTGQRAYYDGESEFSTDRASARVYSSLAHARAAAVMLERDGKHLKRGWRLVVIPVTRSNPDAEKLYEDFHGEPPRHLKTRKLPQFRWGVEIGPVFAITYDTVRDGKKIRFEHEFSKRASPLLIASDSGRELALTGGSYQFTDRGIVDRDRR